MRSASLGFAMNALEDITNSYHWLLPGVGPWFKRQEADTQSSLAKDVTVDVRPKRKRMLTLEEMLNPADGEPAPEEEDDKTKKKPRVARDVRCRVRSPRKRIPKKYAVMRMKL
ncbi:MAG: hypothetical protein Q9211_002256 [Gyalolechia sp. 1 TL-2023]